VKKFEFSYRKHITKKTIYLLKSIYTCLFHNAKELILVDFTVSIFVKLIDHSLQLIVGKVFSKFARNSSQIAKTDAAAVVLVKQLKGLEDLLDWVTLLNLVRHYLQKVNVLDGAGPITVIFVHKTENFGFLYIKTESAHCYFELMIVNCASLIGIEQIKSFLDLLFLFFS